MAEVVLNTKGRASTERLVQYGTVANAVSTVVANVTAVSFPDGEIEEVEITDDQSPDNTRQFGPGWADPGEVNVTYNYRSSTFLIIENLKSDAMFWTITVRGGTVAFPGFVKSNNHDGDLDSTAEAEFTIRVTGKPVFTVAV